MDTKIHSGLGLAFVALFAVGMFTYVGNAALGVASSNGNLAAAVTATPATTTPCSAPGSQSVLPTITSFGPGLEVGGALLVAPLGSFKIPSFPIIWTSLGLSSSTPVRISLYQNGVQISTLVNSAPNTGSWLWTPQTSQGVKPGANYSINVTEVGDNSVHGMSYDFPISNPINISGTLVGQSQAASYIPSNSNYWSVAYPTFQFTITNNSLSPVPIDKIPTVAVYSRLSSGSTILSGTGKSISKVVVTPATESSDTSGYYIIPPGTSRTFDYYFTISNVQGTSTQQEEISIDQINFGAYGVPGTPENEQSYISSGLQGLLMYVPEADGPPV